MKATQLERRQYRLAAARRDVPELLTWAGGLTLGFGIVNYFAMPEESAWAWAVNLVFGPAFLLLAWLIRSTRLPDSVIPWIWALSSLALVAMLINVFRLQPTPANLAYVAASMTAFGPLTNAWWPFMWSSAGMLVFAAFVFAWTPGVVFVETYLVCVASVLISSVLLRMRVKTLGALADAQALAVHQSMTDPMTDTLNRHGLERSIASLVATAGRSGDRILVWFIDIRGLKAANDQHGHRFGDGIILAVTNALSSCVRTNDVVARWGGDEFIVLGLGQHGSADDLDDRVNAALRNDVEIRRQWTGAVTIGFASGDPSVDVHALIDQADADMYRRRAATGPVANPSAFEAMYPVPEPGDA
jgi:diguanylate cyclase (GGDEF)-like protein